MLGSQAKVLELGIRAGNPVPPTGSLQVSHAFGPESVSVALYSSLTIIYGSKRNQGRRPAQAAILKQTPRSIATAVYEDAGITLAAYLLGYSQCGGSLGKVLHR